jgi:hypothetical protein
VLAVAGTDRYDRVYVDDTTGSLRQLCVDCSEGSHYSDHVTISPQCMEFGHHPFGAGPNVHWVG